MGSRLSAAGVEPRSLCTYRQKSMGLEPPTGRSRGRLPPARLRMAFRTKTTRYASRSVVIVIVWLCNWHCGSSPGGASSPYE